MRSVAFLYQQYRPFAFVMFNGTFLSPVLILNTIDTRVLDVLHCNIKRVTRAKPPR